MSDKITGKELLQMSDRELRARYPDLMHLFGAYFNQDWEDSYWWDHEPDYRLVVRTYKREVPEEEVKRAAAQLRELIEVTRDLDEEELGELTWQLGSWLDPHGLGMKEREWLAEVLGILEEPMEETNRYPKLQLRLPDRFKREPLLEYASSFASRKLANWAQRKFIKRYKREIAEWLKTNKPMFKRKLELDRELGLVVDRKGRMYKGTKVEAVLVRDETEVGYHVLTIYIVK